MRRLLNFVLSVLLGYFVLGFSLVFAVELYRGMTDPTLNGAILLASTLFVIWYRHLRNRLPIRL